MAADGGSFQASSQAALRQMVDHAGVGLYETAVDGTFRFVNRTLANLLGYPDEQALIADAPNGSDFYDQPEDQARVRELVGSQEVARGMLLAARRRDGKRIWVREDATAIKDADGRVQCYVGSVTDVTDLVEAQARVAEAEASYRRIFERASEGIYRSSLDGRMLRANPALVRLNGYDTEQELNEAVTNIAKEWYVDPQRRAEFRARLERDGKVEEFESEIYRHATRERIWISENAYLVRDETGAPLYYEGTVRDITRRKQAEAARERALAEAEQANRAKSRFLAHMSHELRTPMNAILGFSDILRTLPADRLDADRVQRYADDIHASGAHLLELINDVLDLSRIESDAVPIEPEPLDPADLLARALETVRPIAWQRGITLEDGCGGTPMLLADRRAIHQCLLNLLSNAVKHAPERTGRVRVRAAPRDERVVLAVADDGPGIPGELLARLGEPFNAGDRPDRAAGSGTGLGLAITRGLADRMNGRLEIDSAPGQGTEARLILPAAG